MKVNIETIENKFFTTVQYVGFAVASIATIVFFVVAFSSISAFLSSANEKVATSEHSLKDYKQHLKEVESSKTAKMTSEKTDKKQSKTEEKKESKPTKNQKLIGEIAENFEVYAKKNEQTTATAAEFESYINRSLANLDEDLNDKYIKQLHKASKDFKKLDVKADETPIQWQQFFSWQHKLFMDEVNLEYKRIQEEQAQVEIDQMMAFTKLPVLLGVLGAFFFFTLILVLLRIERNTRKNAA